MPALIDPDRPSVRRLLLAPLPGRLEYAVRATLIGLGILLVYETNELSGAATAVFLTLFMLKPSRTESVATALAFTILVTLVIGFVFLVSMAVIDHPFWRVAAIAAISTLLLWIGGASRIAAIAPILALVTGYALDLLGNVPFGEAATRALLYAWLLVAIPAAITVAVNFAIGPSPRRMLEAALADRLSAAAAALSDPDLSSGNEVRRLLDASWTDLRKLLGLASKERSVAGNAVNAYSSAISSTFLILSVVDLLVVEESYRPSEETETTAATLFAMAGALRSGGYPRCIEAPVVTRKAVVEGRVYDLLSALSQALSGFSESAVPTEREAKSAFLKPDWTSNPVYLTHALKVTGAAMICLLLYQQLDWPGIHTCFITCYIVSLDNVAETVRKLTLRIVGAAAGAAAGLAALVFALPHVTSFAGLALVTGPILLIGGWIVGGGPRIAYAGIQIELAFLLSVLQEPHPAFDLAVGRDRVIGVLIGNLVTYLIFTRISPVSLAGRVRVGLRDVWNRVATLAEDHASSDMAARHGSDRDRLTAVAQDLWTLRYEGRDLRPSDRWITDNLMAVQILRRLQSSLLLGRRRLDGWPTRGLQDLHDDASRSLPPSSDDGTWRFAVEGPLRELNQLNRQGGA